MTAAQRIIAKATRTALCLSLLVVTLIVLAACNEAQETKPLSASTRMNTEASTLQDTQMQNRAEENSDQAELAAAQTEENRPAEESTPAPAGDLMSGYYFLNAPCYNQTAIGAVMGCEGAALLDGLHVKGYAPNYDLAAILAEMPIAPDRNPHHGFGGTSAYHEDYYDEQGREVWNGIFPAPLAEWGRRYGSVQDISGSSAQDLVAELAAGNPSVVYITPYWDGGGGLQEWWFGVTVAQQHVVLLDGYDGVNGQYHICDPYFGKFWIDSATFEYNYNLLHWAVVIR